MLQSCLLLSSTSTSREVRSRWPLGGMEVYLTCSSCWGLGGSALCANCFGVRNFLVVSEGILDPTPPELPLPDEEVE